MFAIIFITFMLGAFTGVIAYEIVSRKKSIGDLRIDNSDPDGPYLFLELSVDPNEILKHRCITLQVNTKSYISQQ